MTAETLYLKKRGILKTVPVMAAFTALLCIFASCAGMPREQAEIETEPAFLGDFDPVRLENVMALRSVFGKIKPAEIRLYLVPRTNVVEAHFRDGANAVVLMFTAKQRQMLAEGMDLYAKAYAEYAAGDVKSLPDRKPGRKNAFNRGELSVAWGIISVNRTAETEFRTNYQYLEKGKPYFMLTAERADASDGSNTQSPLVNLYFSPSQLKALSEITSRDALQKEVDILNKKAFDF